MDLKSIVESILFIYGEPVSMEKLADVTGRKKDEIIFAIADLKKNCEKRGLVVIEKDGKYQLGTNPENTPYIETLIKTEFSEELSKAALETIAIIAYKGPLARSEIEYIRGVNSSFTLRNLLMRGLVERIENPKDARAYLYKVSFEFLGYLGLKKVEDLPRFEEFKKEQIEIVEEKKGPEAA